MKSLKSLLFIGCPILSRVGARFSDDSVRISMGRTGIRTGTFILPLILLLVSLCALPAPAATLYVDDDACPTTGTGTLADPYCSIQTAIDAAIDTDEILVAPGTYFEKINFIGKAIALRSTDGPNVTTIDATGLADSVVKCITGETSATLLEGFTITGGTGDTSLFGTEFQVGGGMFNDGSSPTINNCLFIDNVARGGGGMYNRGSSPTVANCTFSGNTADSSGGGMQNDWSNPTVTNCAFSGNASFSGGGMLNHDSDSIVANCTFTGNTADANGGGMNNQSSNPAVTNCIFAGNTATLGDGGGIYNFISSPAVTNCTFTGNMAASGGGGIYNLISSPMLTNCTFSGNTAGTDGGGVFNDSRPTMINCIFWNNSDAGGMDESAQIHKVSGLPVVINSDVQGGWSGGP